MAMIFMLLLMEEDEIDGSSRCLAVALGQQMLLYVDPGGVRQICRRLPVVNEFPLV